MAVQPVAIQIVPVPVRHQGLDAVLGAAGTVVVVRLAGVSPRVEDGDAAVVEGARVVAPLETVLRNGRALISSGEKQFPI